jgi:CIC family chloride channel protein
MSLKKRLGSARWLRLDLLLAQRLSQWHAHSMLVWAALIGALGALVTVAFRECLGLAQWMFTQHDRGLVQTAMSLPAWQRVLVPALGGLLAGSVLAMARRLPQSRSAPDYMEAIAIGDGIIGVRQSLMRSLSCVLSVGSGASIGREGPMVQLAAMAASWIGQRAAFDQGRLRLLVACGAAAGIASAYNAPVAGALFVSEIVLGSIAMPAFGPLVVSSVTASVVIHQLLGYRPTYDMPTFAPVGGAAILHFVALGLIAGVCAPGFLSLLEIAKRGFERLHLALPTKLALGGLVVGLLSIWVPQVWGNGYSVVSAMLQGPSTIGALTTVLMCKVLATTATVGSGAVGGVFTPTLFVGAALGALLAAVLDALQPGLGAGGAVFVAVGMGAMLAATTHAPLMAIIMITEMTASYQLALPLMLSCVLAYTVSRVVRSDSVYSASLQRQREAQPRRPVSALRMRELLKPERSLLGPDASLRAVAQAFAARRVQYLYVTDPSGRFLGAVSLHDVSARIGSSDGVRLSVNDILLRDFSRLEPDMGVSEALAVFAKHHGERLPVVGPAADGGRLLGSVTKTDLLFALQDVLSD